MSPIAAGDLFVAQRGGVHYKVLAEELKVTPPSNLWTPEGMAGLLAWNDAADAGTITATAGKVSQWGNKVVGGPPLMQANGSLQPTYESTGKPYLLFDSHVLVDTIAASGLSDCSMFICAHLLSMGSDEDILCGIGTAGRENKIRALYRTGGGTGDRLGFACWANDVLDTPFILDTTSGFVLAATQSGSSVSLAKNGTASAFQLPQQPLPVDYDASSIGSIMGNDSEISTYFTHCQVFERLVFNRSVDNSEQQKIEGYLAHRWGLAASLPADHPYKSAPPTK